MTLNAIAASLALYENHKNRFVSLVLFLSVFNDNLTPGGGATKKKLMKTFRMLAI